MVVGRRHTEREARLAHVLLRRWQAGLSTYDSHTRRLTGLLHHHWLTHLLLYKTKSMWAGFVKTIPQATTVHTATLTLSACKA